MGAQVRGIPGLTATVRLVLHIGQHKTGSKALQSALYANRDYLATHATSYPLGEPGTPPPRPQQMNHFVLFQALREHAEQGCDRSGHNGPRSASRAATSLGELRLILERWLSEVDPHTSTVVLSAEDLFHMHTAHERAFSLDIVRAGARALSTVLREAFREVRIVCYLRRQDHLLAAHYAQLIKGTAAEHPAFDEFVHEFRPRLDSNAILECWEEAFGTASMCVAAYEPSAMDGGIVGDFFRRALGYPPPSVPPPFAGDAEAQNATPSRPHIEFMRLMNRRSSGGLATLPREAALESAFRDTAADPRGIAAWLSPAQRAELVGEFERGNQAIARRHNLGMTLFAEPLPAADDRWQPGRPLDLMRLVSLDAMARQCARHRRLTPRTPGAGLGSILRRWRSACRTRRLLIVAGPNSHPEDLRLATALVAGVAGARHLEPVLVPSLTHAHLMRLGPPIAMVIAVGPPPHACSTSVRLMLQARRLTGTRVTHVIGHVPSHGDGTRRMMDLATAADTWVCTSMENARGVASVEPRLANALNRAVLEEAVDLFQTVERTLLDCDPNHTRD